ncbi:MAG: hypothetical protein HQM09_19380 [Candidatus Riflebacteria bacterium]|nr:hypothetical protein [Candidatus Riflebacteria bacterium]
MRMEKRKTTSITRSDLQHRRYDQFEVESIEKHEVDDDPSERDSKLDLLLEILTYL